MQLLKQYFIPCLQVMQFSNRFPDRISRTSAASAAVALRVTSPELAAELSRSARSTNTCAPANEALEKAEGSILELLQLNAINCDFNGQIHNGQFPAATATNTMITDAADVPATQHSHKTNAGKPSQIARPPLLTLNAKVSWNPAIQELRILIPACDLPRSDLKSPFQALTVLAMGSFSCVSSPFICLPYQVCRPSSAGQSAGSTQQLSSAGLRCEATRARRSNGTQHIPHNIAPQSHVHPCAVDFPSQFAGQYSNSPGAVSRCVSAALHTASGRVAPPKASETDQHNNVPMLSWIGIPSAQKVVRPGSPLQSALPAALHYSTHGQMSFRGSDTVDESFYQQPVTSRMRHTQRGGATAHFRSPQGVSPALARTTLESGSTLDAAQALLGIRTHSNHSEPGVRATMRPTNGGVRAGQPRGQKRPRASSEAAPHFAWHPMPNAPKASRPSTQPGCVAVSDFTAHRDRSWPAQAVPAAGGQGQL